MNELEIEAAWRTGRQLVDNAFVSREDPGRITRHRGWFSFPEIGDREKERHKKHREREIRIVFLPRMGSTSPLLIPLFGPVF